MTSPGIPVGPVLASLVLVALEAYVLSPPHGDDFIAPELPRPSSAAARWRRVVAVPFGLYVVAGLLMFL